MGQPTTQGSPALGIVMLLPGIFGSKIESCIGANKTGCQPIWDPAQNIVDVKRLAADNSRTVRVDMVPRSTFGDVYGDILTYIDGYRNELVLHPLPFDWRQSNSISAEDIARSICDNVRANPAAKLYFIAHSMGGLVLRHWVVKHAGRTCKGGQIPQVGAIVFAGTPHAGAVKTIYNVVRGYSFLQTEHLEWWEKIERRVFSRKPTLDDFSVAVNEHSVSFPSFFELLPAQAGSECSDFLIEGGYQANVLGSSQKPLNVFDAEVWKQHNFLRLHGSASVLQSYYGDTLPAKLQAASKAICSMATIPIKSKVEDVRYVVGVGHSTISAVVFDGEEISATYSDGDRTVVADSAKDKAHSHSREYREVASTHGPIISDKQVKSSVDKWRSEVLRKRAEVRGSTIFAQGKPGDTGASTLDLNKLSPWSFNPEDWRGEQAKRFREADAAYLRHISVSPEVVASQAIKENRGYRSAEALIAAAHQIELVRFEALAWLFQASQQLEVYGHEEEAEAVLRYVISQLREKASIAMESLRKLNEEARTTLAGIIVRQEERNFAERKAPLHRRALRRFDNLFDATIASIRKFSDRMAWGDRP